MGSSVEVPVNDYARLAETVFRRSHLKQMRALVVGAGALGNEVVKTLGLLGVGKVAVIDPDRVEPTDLTRSLFLRGTGAVGHSKALSLATMAAELFPDTVVNGASKEIADLGFQEVAAANLIFGCVDNDLARLETAYISTQLDVPVVDGGLGTSDYSQGRVSYFPGSAGACFSCRLTQQRRRELLTLWEAGSRPCWLETRDLERRSFPSTPMMASIIGAMQVEFGLRRLLEPQAPPDSVGTNVDISLDPVVKTEAFRLSISPNCPFHGPRPARYPASRPASQIVVRCLLDEVIPSGDDHRKAYLILDWPICTSARCTGCGHRWAPMLRLATLRKCGACPVCGSRQLSEEEVIRAVDRNSRWADFTLEALGIPERHLHRIEFRAEPLV